MGEVQLHGACLDPPLLRPECIEGKHQLHQEYHFQLLMNNIKWQIMGWRIGAMFLWNQYLFVKGAMVKCRG